MHFNFYHLQKRIYLDNFICINKILIVNMKILNFMNRACHHGSIALDLFGSATFIYLKGYLT